MGDLDGDGLDDLVGIAAASVGVESRVQILRSTGASLVLTGEHGPGTDFHSVQLVDLDADGHLDVVASGRGETSPTPSVVVLWMDGDAGIAEVTELRPFRYSDSVGVGDVDEDGFLDLVVPDVLTEGGALVLRGDGARSFTEGPVVAKGTSVGSLHLAELTGDGHLDLALGQAGSLSVLAGDGSGGFSETFRESAEVSLLATADLDHDGDLDLLGLDSYLMWAWFNAGDGRAFTASRVGPESTTWCAVLGDLNADGRTDLVERFYAAGGEGVFLHTPDGLVASGVLQVSAGLGTACSIAIGDLDGDSTVELVESTGSGLVLFDGACDE